MSTYLWSDLIDGQVVSFDPFSDVLYFNGAVQDAYALSWDLQSTSSSFTDRSGKTVTFNGLGAANITVTNLQFPLDNSPFLVGDLLAGTAGDDLDNLIVGYGTDDVLIGLGGNDTLIGGDGWDTLIGSDGNDVLNGGFEDGTLEYAYNLADYSGTGAAVRINLALTTAQNTLGAGNDTLINIQDVMGSDFNDRLSGDGFDNGLFGGQGNDTLSGGAGEDWLEGGEGDDLLSGGSGTSDAASYTSASAAVAVNLAVTSAQNTGGAGQDTLTGIERLIGSDFHDSLTGNLGINVLFGGLGNDTLSGGAGDDYLVGGDGNDFINGGVGLDTLNYGDTNRAIGVKVDLNILTAQNTGGGGIDRLLSIENVTGSKFNDVLTGNAANNELTGGDGADLLMGGAGNDTLYGGFHLFDNSLSDTVSYANASGGVHVDLSLHEIAQAIGADQGTDTLWDIENAIGSSFNDWLSGTTGSNTLTGGAGNDTLIGGAGFDTASYAGSASAVTVSLATALAQNTGGAGVDRLSGIERLIGSSLNDSLSGNNAANQFTGGLGADTLSGGLGADLFIYTSVLESQPGAADTISDFTAVQNDRISLSLIDANTSTAGNGVFSFIGGAAFTGAGQLRFDSATHTVQANVNADLGVDMAIVLTGVNSLAAANFVL